MTEAQRNYLADLAGRKGVRLSNTDGWSVAEASAKIEELKAMLDATFDEITDNEATEVEQRTDMVLVELHKWGFTRRAK